MALSEIQYGRETSQELKGVLADLSTTLLLFFVISNKEFSNN